MTAKYNRWILVFDDGSGEKDVKFRSTKRYAFDPSRDGDEDDDGLMDEIREAFGDMADNLEDHYPTEMA